MSKETEDIVARSKEKKSISPDSPVSKRRRPVLSCRLEKQKAGVETLERLKRWPGVRKNVQENQISIYSREHGAYWREGGFGYTEGNEKWVLTLDEALSHTLHCGPEKQIEFHSVV
jgi:hypothetical protein